MDPGHFSYHDFLNQCGLKKVWALRERVEGRIERDEKPLTLEYNFLIKYLQMKEKQFLLSNKMLDAGRKQNF